MTPHNLEASHHFDRAVEAERSVLGTILIRADAIALARSIVRTEDFSRVAHQKIFRGMLLLSDRGDPITLVTLKYELARAGELEDVGGPAYIAALVDGLPRTTHVEHFSREILVHARALDLVRLCHQGVETFSGDARAVANGDGTRFAEAIRAAVDAAHDDEHDEGIGQAAADFLADVSPEVAPIVVDLIPGSGIVLPHGQPRSRKSYVTLDAGLSVAAGVTPFALSRLVVPEPIVCWYHTEEDAALEVKARLRALLAGHRLSEPPAGFRISAQRGITLDDVVTQDRIIREVLAHSVRLLTLDPIRSLSAAVDKGPGELQPLVRALRRIMRETGVVLQLPHHDTKPKADGRADDRPRAHRASGGGILSISEAPIHVERVSEDVTLLVPSLWKFSIDPPPVKVRFESGPGWMRLIGEAVEAHAADSLAIHERVLGILADSPGLAGNGIAKQARARREDIYQALEALATAGKVDSVKAGRATRWFLKGRADE